MSKEMRELENINYGMSGFEEILYNDDLYGYYNEDKLKYIKTRGKRGEKIEG